MTEAAVPSARAMTTATRAPSREIERGHDVDRADGTRLPIGDAPACRPASRAGAPSSPGESLRGGGVSWTPSASVTAWSPATRSLAKRSRPNVLPPYVLSHVTFGRFRSTRPVDRCLRAPARRRAFPSPGATSANPIGPLAGAMQPLSCSRGHARRRHRFDRGADRGRGRGDRSVSTGLRSRHWRGASDRRSRVLQAAERFSRSLAGRGTRPADLQRTGPRIPRGQPGCPSHGRSSGDPHPTRRSARTRRAGLLHDP